MVMVVVVIVSSSSDIHSNVILLFDMLTLYSLRILRYWTNIQKMIVYRWNEICKSKKGWQLMTSYICKMRENKLKLIFPLVNKRRITFQRETVKLWTTLIRKVTRIFFYMLYIKETVSIQIEIFIRWLKVWNYNSM